MGRDLIFANFIFIFLLPDSHFKKLMKGVWLCPSVYDMCKHQTTVNKERKKMEMKKKLKRRRKRKRKKKRYLHPLKGTKQNKKEKKKEKKESKLKINTELVGEKVPESRRLS